jgi:nitrite reductase/ring-hydroxylating ferredoxin subunit
MCEHADDEIVKGYVRGMSHGVLCERHAASMRLRVGERTFEQHVWPDAAQVVRRPRLGDESLHQPGVRNGEHDASPARG